MTPRSPVLPTTVNDVLDRLWTNGHAAYVVGGALRDLVIGRQAVDWDIATDARPERLLAIFPGSHYENRFGTVTVGGIEVTTFRRDHRYGDRRRPDSVTFTDQLGEDLARRDFTVNAIAWGRAAEAAASGWEDPTGGLDDLRAGCLRAVGDPDVRFDEDALRLLRAVRLAAQLGFALEERTEAAIRRHAGLVGHVSRERVGQELRKMLTAAPPSQAFRLLDSTGLLDPVFPDLAAQRGIAQNKVPGDDLWDHSLSTLDAMAEIARGNETLLLAALFHDVGKPRTLAEGRFPGHDEAGAEIVRDVLTRLALPRTQIERVAALVRWHMFNYEPAWTDAAVRRFIRRVDRDLVDDLCRLREADNVGSGLPRGAGHTDELRARVAAQLEQGAPLSLSELAVDGDDVQEALGREPGPWLGEVLERLLESVVADPARNSRSILLADARRWTESTAVADASRTRTRRGGRTDRPEPVEARGGR